MKSVRFILILLVGLAVAGLPASAAFATVPVQTPARDLAGHWEGSVNVMGQKLIMDLDFARQADGNWKGDISIPSQRAKDLPLTAIGADGPKVTFKIADIPGNATFVGAIGEDGGKITGKYTQNGQTFDFELVRGIDAAAKSKKALEGFEAVVQQGLTKLKVPGAAVAVIKDNDVILAQGFGFRDIENKLPMSADTILAIGSSTKAFTTFALGTLVDQGKVEWDKPVRNYIPWFKLYDAQAGDRLTPRDLVTHRSGLPRHDILWYNNTTISREQLVRSLAFLPPTADLRERFQYNNLMFLTAGYLIETLTGKSWEDSVRSLIFAPLGMTRSNFSVAVSQKDADFAQPYGDRDGKVVKIPFRDITVIGPAGAVNSSVNEMSRWVRVHLNGGKFEDRQVISPAVVEDLHAAYMPTGNQPTRADISPSDYGLGWFVDTYRGHRRVEHGGNIDGFSALVGFLPQDGYGYVILTNKNGTGLPELLARTAIDRLLGLEPVDWIAAAAQEQAAGESVAKKAEQNKASRKKPGTTPAHKLEEYAGEYAHPGYGTLTVTVQGRQLAFAFNRITTPLDHWHYETFNGAKAEDPTFTDMKLTFRTDVNGIVSALEIPLESTLGEVVFAKKPEPRFFDTAYLRKLAGRYDLVTQLATIALKGDTLTASLPGQPPYDLVPEAGGEFSFKQIKVVRVKFIEDDKGEVTGLELSQPGGVFVAKRIK